MYACYDYTLCCHPHPLVNIGKVKGNAGKHQLALGRGSHPIFYTSQSPTEIRNRETAETSHSLKRLLVVH